MATVAPTEEPTIAPTEESTEPLVTGVGYIVNDGNGAKCRPGPSQDEPPITLLADGIAVTTLGDPVDGWQPVLCDDQEGTEQTGYVRAEFISSDPPAATEVATEVATAPGEDAPATEEGAPTEEFAVTEAVTVAPYAVAGVDDSESSGTAFHAVDGDPATTWQVSPAASPDKSWLLLDLGAVLPVERVSIELGYGGSLPPFELWLSEDGQTWWNVGQRPGWDLAYDLAVNAQARYVMVVVPDVAGLDAVGGIGEVRIWPADAAGSLANVGSLVTPEPAPAPTTAPVEDTPTEETGTEVPETIVAATEDAEPEVPETIEATTPDQSDLGGESDATTEETPTPGI